MWSSGTPARIGYVHLFANSSSFQLVASSGTCMHVLHGRAAWAHHCEVCTWSESTEQDLSCVLFWNSLAICSYHRDQDF